MFRLCFWRVLCFLALLGGILQLLGFFLPFSVVLNTVTHTTSNPTSYWLLLTENSAEDAFDYFVGMAFPLFALVSILFPLVIALMELVIQPQRFRGVRLSSLILAILGLLEFLLLAVGSVVVDSICMSGGACVLLGDMAPGFWPSFIGSLLSVSCFLVLLVLGLLWWGRDTAKEQ